MRVSSLSPSLETGETGTETPETPSPSLETSETGTETPETPSETLMKLETPKSHWESYWESRESQSQNESHETLGGRVNYCISEGIVS